ncbi:hypothetical protein FOLKNPGA_01248 [Legionella sp. PC1000]|uniref:helix-turn-helix transcriptional regulator n=1 Tax=Legionella sp. PC1000 TaxID=2746060 RepID=UPI0015FA2130|nr:AlpA family phage regulatory protein [Legionella sp. PC1000]QLZ68469.1 hypothetical protein FOLKNPGA_01248 [Legionella sp. PC1000]
MTKALPIRGVIRWPGLRTLFNDDISRSTIDRWIKDKRFPAKIQLGKNSVGWDLVEVEQWFQEKARTTKGVI